jgi:hypothetical protein
MHPMRAIFGIAQPGIKGIGQGIIGRKANRAAGSEYRRQARMFTGNKAIFQKSIRQAIHCKGDKGSVVKAKKNSDRAGHEFTNGIQEPRVAGIAGKALRKIEGYLHQRIIMIHEGLGVSYQKENALSFL